jgi:predicted outer membrane protein
VQRSNQDRANQDRANQDRANQDRANQDRVNQDRVNQDKGQCGSSSVSEQDRNFLMTSIEGDHFEIAGGGLAQRQAVDAATKALGARLVADHTKSLAEATSLARKLDVPVPSTMSEKQQEELAKQATYAGLRFDEQYSELETSDHRTDIKDATDEVEHGCNSQVRDNARSEIPVLKTHLAMSEDVHGIVQAKLDRANQDKANQDKANQDKANQDKANQDKANQDKANQDKANQDKAKD